MQFPQFLAVFTQLPLFLSNITAPASTSSISSAAIAVTGTSTETPNIASGATGTPAADMPLTAMLANTLNPKKYSLPELPYAYDALEPYISKQIMELHHKKHHQAYINNLNDAMSQHVTALTEKNLRKQLELQQMIKFNGGGHINHSLFWKNLAPADSPDASPAAAPKLIAEITKTWGSYDNFKAEFSKVLLGLQGSGWGWLSRYHSTGVLTIVVTKDQDPILGGGIPIFGIDMWEHAYYLQYYNDKPAYVKGIWNIINWKVAEERFLNNGELSLF